MPDLGRWLIVLGCLAILAGLLLLLVPRVPWLGRLPGDIVVHRGPITFYFPLMTSLVVSIVLSLVLGLFSRR